MVLKREGRVITHSQDGVDTVVDSFESKTGRAQKGDVVVGVSYGYKVSAGWQSVNVMFWRSKSVPENDADRAQFELYNTVKSEADSMTTHIGTTLTDLINYVETLK